MTFFIIFWSFYFVAIVKIVHYNFWNPATDDEDDYANEDLIVRPGG